MRNGPLDFFLKRAPRTDVCCTTETLHRGKIVTCSVNQLGVGVCIAYFTHLEFADILGSVRGTMHSRVVRYCRKYLRNTVKKSGGDWMTGRLGD
jgi:hypothetical protein